MPSTSTAANHAQLSVVQDAIGRPADCECLHGEGSGTPCENRAAVRVTLVCRAEGCDCAAAVYLWCHPCLIVHQRRAKRDGVVLRVREL